MHMDAWHGPGNREPLPNGRLRSGQPSQPSPAPSCPDAATGMGSVGLTITRQTLFYMWLTHSRRLADRTDRREVPAASISNCASWTPAADPPVRVAVAVGDMGLGWVCLPEKVQVRTRDTGDARTQPDLGRVQPRLSASSSLNATWTYCGLNSG